MNLAELKVVMGLNMNCPPPLEAHALKARLSARSPTLGGSETVSGGTQLQNTGH